LNQIKIRRLNWFNSAGSWSRARRGQTGTIGKLPKNYSDAGLKVRLAAGDTFRAAAVEQEE